ncbi:MAG TPA: hypothetical protein VLY21_06940 [Nitrososphaerales archaeon]|nr:hypothetical protein [Nitrososphaerales archaeon]
MITVRCLGHICTSLGREEVSLEGDGLEAGEIVDRLRSMVAAGSAGFDRYNTLALVDKGEACVAAASSRKIRDGETVVLIPFSHGG